MTTGRIGIGIIGDRRSGYRKHDLLAPALLRAFSAAVNGTREVLRAEWLGTTAFEGSSSRALLREWHAVIIAPQSPEYCRSTQGLMNAIVYAKESPTPCLAICGGFQFAVLTVAGHPERDPAFRQSRGILRLAAGVPTTTDEGTFRCLGRRTVTIVHPSRVAEIYEGAAHTVEEYACNYVVPACAAPLLQRAGLSVSALDGAANVAAVELPNHPLFVGTAFLPQFRPESSGPHPLLVRLVHAALETRRQRGA